MRKWRVLVGFLVAAPCFAQEPQTTETPDPQIKANQIQAEVAEIRGMPFKRPIKAEKQSLTDFGSYLDSALEQEVPPEIKRYYGRIIRKLGLYSGPTIENVSDMMKMVMTSQAGAYYDPDKQTFFVLMAGMNDLLLGGLFAHELYHGMQDQYFDLNKYLLQVARKHSLDSDEVMARQAVVEGEATYMMTLWMLKRVTGSIPKREVLTPAVTMQANMDMEMLRATLKQPQVAQMMGEDMKSAVAAIDQIPPFVFDQLIGSYLKGLGFVFAVEGQGGWKEIEKLYTTSPPASMEQILHPDKWIGNEKPSKITFASLQSKVLRDYDVLDQDVLGEFRWRSIFKAQGLAAEAEALSAGWDGDRYAVFKHKTTDELLLTIYTSWDSDEEAREFAAGYQRALATKNAESKEATRVVQKGRTVLIVEGGTDSGIESVVGWLAQAKLAKAK